MANVSYRVGRVEVGWPDASNTGVPAGTTLTNYTGPTLVTTNGTLIENKIIEDTIEIQAANVTIRNCRVQNSGLHGIFGDTATNVTIDHCDIVGSGGASVATGILTSGTFTANDISGFALGIQMTGPGTVTDNYIHDLTKAGVDVHFDGIAMFGGQSGILIEHNAIYVPSIGGTGNIFLKNAFGGIDNVTIRNNLLRGGPGYTIPMDSNTVGSSITNVTVTNNVMETGAFGYFAVDGSLYTNISGTGNTDYLTGVEVPFPDTNVPADTGPISFGSIGTVNSYASHTNLTLSPPASIANGDLLLAFAFVAKTGGAPSISAAAGWSSLTGSPTDVTDAGTLNGKYYVFYKIASSESGSYTFNHTTSNSCGVICRYTGVDTASPFTPTPTTNTGTGTVCTATGFTTAVADTFVIFTEHDWGDNSDNCLVPSGSSPVFTERLDEVLMYIADGTRGAVGAIGNKSHTCNSGSGGKWAAYLIGLRPA